MADVDVSQLSPVPETYSLNESHSNQPPPYHSSSSSNKTNPSDDSPHQQREIKILSSHHPPPSDSVPSTPVHRQPQLQVSFRSAIMFLTRAIEKIAAEREMKKSQNSNVRKACNEALDLLKGTVSNGTTTDEADNHLPPLRSESGMLLADEKLLRPFQLACSMKSARIVTTAIDSLQKLIAYGHVPNEAVGSSGKVRIIEQIVTTICSCFQGVQTDDGIQLQVLKALLTVITSPVVEIHEADVLLVVRTCYNIFMATKNAINQATARATLTQIISVIFQRMEQNALEAAVVLSSTLTSPLPTASTSPALSTTAKQIADGDQSNVDVSITDENERIAFESSNSSSPQLQSTVEHTDADSEPEDSEAAESVVKSILDEIIEHPIRMESSHQFASETLVASTDDHATPPSNHLTNGSSSPALLDPKPDSPTTIQPEVVTMAHVTQKDAFLVFRSLCRLATKEFGNSRSSDAKSNAVRSKTLSLQLILNVFQSPGPLFLSSEIFISAIKQYLCVALIKNGVSPVAEVCELSVRIFLILLNHFKPHLKRPIEVFLKDVLLELLDSPKSSFEHKWIVMQAVRQICADAQSVVDIYLNYDCDMNMANLFERLTTSLSKIAQGRWVTSGSGTAASDQSQRQAMRTKGLECLVLILRCMVDWSHELYATPESQSFWGSEPETLLTDVDGSGSVNGDPVAQVIDSLPKAVDDPGDFESRKAQKEIYETGLHLFNKGRMDQALQLLQKHNLIEESIDAVASLFRSEDRLCKVKIGEYLGENDPYHLSVMYAYVDQFDFADKQFVPAMRELLAGFRLPGEAQKIDRLVEKFAARYCACNPNNGLFASADTAYVLAFSIIILTTDLHSGQIKAHHRMSKDDYVRMNRGINDSQDLPESYLADIYDAIAKCGIKLRPDDPISKLSSSHTLNGDDGDRKQRSIAPNSASHLTKNRADAGQFEVDVLDSSFADFTSATHCEHVRPMFKLAWTPFLAAFSVGLQDSDALDVAHLCLEGIRYSIRIACIFHMDTERDAYVQALARFTLLLTSAAAAFSGGSTTTNSTTAAHPTSTSTPISLANTPNRRQKSEISLLTHHSPTGLNVTTNFSSSTSSPTAATTTTMSVPEAMKQKNIDTIRTLITVAQTDGNYLGHAWLEILRCISQLESAHLIAQPSHPTGVSHHHHTPGRSTNSTTTNHGSIPMNGPTNRRSTTGSASITHHSSAPNSISTLGNSYSLTNVTEPRAPGSLAAASVDPKKAAILQEVMGETGSHSVVVAVDKIFTGSIRLNGDAIVDFVKALCQVSLEELMLNQPRTFSLQKVVEISYYNMGRIRLQWSRVWEHIGNHFTSAGQSPNEDVAEFVVDSLRQLSVKLIEKGELPNFHFQKEFLRPFVSILDNRQNLSRNIQDMVIRCVSQLVHSQYLNIRSGWTNIFAVFQHVAGSSIDEPILDMAFESCNFTVSTVFNHHPHVLLDAFQPLIKLLADFACNLHYPDTAMESIRLIRNCAELVSKHGPMFNSPTVATGEVIVSPTASLNSSLTDEDSVWLKGWLPVLCELFRVINSCKLDVRTRGLTVFFDILKTYGVQFKPLWWRDTFTVIFRVFQQFRAPPLNGYYSSSTPPQTAVSASAPSVANHGLALSLMEQTEWMNTTCNHTLFSVVDVFTQYYDVLHPILLDDVYAQLRWCCLQEHEQLARSGTSCLETLVLSTGPQFSPEIWDRTVHLIVGLFDATVPHQLLTWHPDVDLDHSVTPTVTRSSPHTNTNAAIDGGDESPPVPRYLTQARLFADLLIKCVVQYELIQTVDHILFYSAHSRNEDTHYLNETRELAVAAYPAYAAALKASALRSSSSSSHSSHRPISQQGPPDESSINDQRWTPDETVDGEQEDEKSRHEPLLWLGPGGGRIVVGAAPLPNDSRGMYRHLSPQQRLTLARCLIKSHTFAKQFNSNDTQRNVLFEAGFKVKAKPNLLKQETHSLLCCLRILFRLAEEDTEVRDEAEDLLDRVILDALSYYHNLLVDGHRQAWDPCLILLLSQLTRLTPATRFHLHSTRLYAPICDLVSMAGAISPEVATLIRLFLLRCGAFFLPHTRSDM